MIQNFLIFLLFTTVIAAADNVCKLGNIVHMPSTEPVFYWPTNWRENQTAPHLTKEQSCSWLVTVPSGYYAKLIISGKTADKDSRFQMIDSAGNLVQSTHEKMEPYYFPEFKFTLAVSNEASATFAFKVEWKKLPTAGGGDYGISSVPYRINATNTVYSSIYGANRVSLWAVPSDPNNLYALRSVLIYEGTGQVDNYATNMYLIAKTGQQYISISNGVRIFNLEASADSQDVLFIQNYEYVQDLTVYKLFECRGKSNCTGTVDGKKSKSGLVNADSLNMTLTHVDMKDDANMTVYFGSPTPFGFYKEFVGADLKTQLPMSFYGWAVQYVFSYGKATLTFSL